MKRLSLLGLGKEKDALLGTLARFGCLDISEDATRGEAELQALTERDAPDARLVELQSEEDCLGAAIAVATPFDSRKRQLLHVKDLLTARELDKRFADRGEALAAAEKLNETQEKRNALETEINRLGALAESLLPFEAMDIPLGQMETRSAKAMLGVVPGELDFEKAVTALEEEIPQCCLQTISETKEHRFVLVIFHGDLEHDLLKSLKKLGFSQTAFRGLAKTPREEREAALARQELLSAERDGLTEEIRALAGELTLLEIAYDSVSARMDQEKVKQRLRKTAETFYLSGYFPARVQDVLEKQLEPYCCAFEVEEPALEEEVPVLLQNNAVVAPYEMVTELYSMPAYRGIDPDTLMAPFFCLFFGMMLSDAGYGLLITAVCAFALWKYKPRGGMRKALGLGLQCGISTTVMGFVFGSFFGDLIPVIQGMITGTPGKVICLINPMTEPMTVLIISMLLGVLHLFVGLGIKMYMLIRDGDWFAALADNGLWILLISGLGLIFLGGTAGKAGTYLAIAAAVCLVLTQGREKKNIIMKFFSGVLSLYGITGYLSDILSYSRLLALGLATAVISSVINAMGAMGGASFFGFLVLALAVVVGHTVNLGINVLGAFVHSSRLQYVEFFGKFYESGDKKFTPFRANTKYIEVDG